MRILRNGYTVKPAGGSSAWTDGSAASTLLLDEFFGPPAISATVTATEAADTLSATATITQAGGMELGRGDIGPGDYSISGFNPARRKSKRQTDDDIEGAIAAASPSAAPLDRAPADTPPPDPPAPLPPLPAVIDFSAAERALQEAKASEAALAQALALQQEEDEMDMLFMIALAA